jgi:RimJ/RimL family protein N-acetyltransferase
MRTITTARVLLEPVTVATAVRLWKVLQAPDLRDFQDLPDLSPQAFERSVASRPKVLETGSVGRFEWLIVPRSAPDEAIGWVSVRIAERAPSIAEIGYSVVRDWRGRGIASEAVAALVEECFVVVNVRRVRAYCVPENHSSRAVLRNNGFTDDGILPHGATVQGHPVDVVSYVLERRVWDRTFTANRSAIGS